MIVVAAVDTDVYTPAGPPVEVFEARLVGASATATHEPFACAASPARSPTRRPSAPR